MQPKQFRTAQWTHSSTNGTGLRKGRNAEECREMDFFGNETQGAARLFVTRVGLNCQ